MYQNSKVVPKVQEPMKICAHKCRTKGKIRKTLQIFGFPRTGKKIMKITAILCNWKTVDLMEAGFSSNNKAKRLENTPGQYYDRFPDT